MRKVVAADLKTIYSAATADEAVLLSVSNTVTLAQYS
jgi:hypothetical protein